MKKTTKKRHAWKYPAAYARTTKKRPAVCQRQGCGWLLWTENSKKKSPWGRYPGQVAMVSAPGGTPIPYSRVPACRGI